MKKLATALTFPLWLLASWFGEWADFLFDLADWLHDRFTGIENRGWREYRRFMLDMQRGEPAQDHRFVERKIEHPDGTMTIQRIPVVGEFGPLDADGYPPGLGKRAGEIPVDGLGRRIEWP